MPVTVSKIRLGAPDSMQLFNTYDLGGSMGGAELDYNPTMLQVEIDQAVMPVTVFRTKEEITFTVALVQYQMDILMEAFSYGPTIATTAGGTLASAAAPTVTSVGGATGSYSYQIVAFSSAGDAIPSTAGTTTTGPATLSSTAYNTVTWTAVTGAAGYKVIRSAGGATQGLIGTVYPSSVLSFNDTGFTAAAYVAATVNPTFPNTNTSNFGGQAYVPIGPFDWSVPKSDGTTNKLRGHLNKVASYKAIKVDFKRDKITEANKVSLVALADLTQPTGRQAGYLIEEF